MQETDLVLETLHLPVELRNIADNMLQLQVFDVFILFQLGSLILGLKLHKLRVDTLLRLRNMHQFVVLQDGVVNFELDLLPLSQVDFFGGEICIKNIRYHRQVVIVPDHRTHDVYLAVHQDEIDRLVILLLSYLFLLAFYFRIRFEIR